MIKTVHDIVKQVKQQSNLLCRKLLCSNKHQNITDISFMKKVLQNEKQYLRCLTLSQGGGGGGGVYPPWINFLITF